MAVSQMVITWPKRSFNDCATLLGFWPEISISASIITALARGFEVLGSPPTLTISNLSAVKLRRKPSAIRPRVASPVDRNRTLGLFVVISHLRRNHRSLSLHTLAKEVVADRPGAMLASNQLAQVLCIQIIHSYLEASGPGTAGWLRALSDKRIAPALRLMHREPARAWRLDELAKQVAMSRTSFAVRFQENCRRRTTHVSRELAHAPCGAGATRRLHVGFRVGPLPRLHHRECVQQRIQENDGDAPEAIPKRLCAYGSVNLAQGRSRKSFLKPAPYRRPQRLELHAQ